MIILSEINLNILEEILKLDLHCSHDLVFNQRKLTLNRLRKLKLLHLAQVRMLNLAHDFQRRIELAFRHHLLDAAELTQNGQRCV